MYTLLLFKSVILVALSFCWFKYLLHIHVCMHIHKYIRYTYVAAARSVHTQIELHITLLFYY